VDGTSSGSYPKTNLVIATYNLGVRLLVSHLFATLMTSYVDRIITETNLKATIDIEAISFISLNFLAKDESEMNLQINLRALVLAEITHPDAPGFCIPCPQY
jgi:hypothetical protein